MRKIGVLITGHVREELVEAYGEYGKFFERLIGSDGFEFHDYFVVDQKFPSNVNECDAYVLSGSAHGCLLYTSPSPRDQRGSRMPSSA